MQTEKLADYIYDELISDPTKFHWSLGGKILNEFCYETHLVIRCPKWNWNNAESDNVSINITGEGSWLSLKERYNDSIKEVSLGQSQRLNKLRWEKGPDLVEDEFRSHFKDRELPLSLQAIQALSEAVDSGGWARARGAGDLKVTVSRGVNRGYCSVMIDSASENGYGYLEINSMFLENSTKNRVSFPVSMEDQRIFWYSKGFREFITELGKLEKAWKEYKNEWSYKRVEWFLRRFS